MEWAFAGLGLVMEHVAHLVKRMASPSCAIPIDLTAVEVGPSIRGREMISLDLSEYGDPLCTRTVRVPFSGYLKPWQQVGSVGAHVVRNLVPLVFVPVPESLPTRGLHALRDPRQAAALAREACAKIPDMTTGTGLLLERYRQSPLRDFHDWFYSESHEPPKNWPRTYDRVDESVLPRCVREIFACPNDLLLRPANMRMVSQVFLARGWHPRHIAGLIRSKFERDHHWGTQWKGYDQGLRADFYTRIFSGLFAVAIDDFLDCNCQSAREKGVCPPSACPHNLDDHRRSALEKRHDNKLADWTLDRMLP